MDTSGQYPADRKGEVDGAGAALAQDWPVRPVRVGDVVSLYGRLVTRGRTSMKIEVEAWSRARDSEETVKVTEAVFTFVAIDPVTRRPRPLPEE